MAAGNFLGQDHCVMTGATYHAMWFTAGFSDCVLNFMGEKRDPSPRPADSAKLLTQPIARAVAQFLQPHE